MTAPAASSQLGWLLKHLDGMTDDELRTLHYEVTRRATYRGIYQTEQSKAFAQRLKAMREEVRGSRSAA